MPRNLGFLLLLVGMASLGGAWAWLTSEDEGAGDEGGRPPYVLPVTLATVERGDVRPSVHLTGTVRSARWARLSLELSGALAELHAQEADSVVAGQLLAKLNDEDQRLALASFEAARVVAERELQRLQAGERKEEVDRLKAQLDAAEAEEQLADLEVDRRRDLAALSDVSKAEMDRVLATARAATARREAVAQQLAQAEAGTRVEDLAIATARLAQASAASARATRELEKTSLHAPWDGVVVTRRRSVGDYVTPGDVLFEVADMTNLEIDVEVPSAYGLRLGEQPDVVVRVDEAPDWTLATQLDAAVPTADRVSRNFRGIVRLDAGQAEGKLRPGMFARLELMLATVPDALVVPADAVRTTEGGPVLVVADGEGDDLVGRFVPVRVLGAETNRAAVEPQGEPLSPGDRVVVTGVDLAFPGVPLMPRDDGPAGADGSTGGSAGGSPGAGSDGTAGSGSGVGSASGSTGAGPGDPESDGTTDDEGTDP